MNLRKFYFVNLNYYREFGIVATSLYCDEGIGQGDLKNVQSISKIVH